MPGRTVTSPVAAGKISDVAARRGRKSRDGASVSCALIFRPGPSGRRLACGRRTGVSGGRGVATACGGTT